MKDCFYRGERVASTVMGLAYGIPGRIIGADSVQFITEPSRRFIVELEETGQRISVPAIYLKELPLTEKGGGKNNGNRKTV